MTFGTLYMSKKNIKKIEESKELQEKAKQWNNSKIDTITFVMAINNYKKEKS